MRNAEAWGHMTAAHSHHFPAALAGGGQHLEMTPKLPELLVPRRSLDWSLKPPQFGSTSL